MDRPESPGKSILVVFVLVGWSCQDVIDQTVCFGFVCTQEKVAIGVFRDRLDGLAAVGGNDFVQNVTVAEHFRSLDFDIADLTTNATHGLMHHHSAIRQAVPFAFGSADQQHGSTTARFTNAVRRDVARQDLHRVVDRERCCHAPAWRIDVEVNVFAAVFALQIQQLHDQFIGVAGMNFALQKNDAVFQQQVAQCELTLTLIALLSMTTGDLSGAHLAGGEWVR